MDDIPSILNWIRHLLDELKTARAALASALTAHRQQQKK